MKNLFYSHKEGLLFFIMKIRTEGQVSAIISDFEVGANTVANIAKLHKDCIEVIPVTGSSKNFKSMHVFKVRLNEYPGIGLELGPDWDLKRIISDWIE